MKKSLFLLAAAAMVACSESSQQESAEATTAQELMFTTSISLPSKATDTDFESSDVIAVTAYDKSGTLVKDAAQYTHNGSLFMSSEPIVYDTEEAEYTFYAVYPTVSSLQTSLDFYAKADQSVDGAFAASDMLFATMTSSDAIPRLSFYHKMSSIVVNIVGDDSGSVVFNAKTGLSYGVANNTTTALGNAVEITPASNGTASFKVIIAPQTIASGTTLATYTVGNLVYDWVVDANMDFASGSQYQFNWSLADREVTLDSVINGWDIVDGGTVESK